MDRARATIKLLGDLAMFVWLVLRPHCGLAAENLFLRKQLAMFQERKLKPRRPDAPFRIALVLLSRLFDWRDALVVVQTQTLVRWHRQGFRLFWRWKSRPGRPRIPIELRRLIREMALSNPPWGEERIANELLLKLGVRVSPRTISKYMPNRTPINAGRPSCATMRRHTGLWLLRRPDCDVSAALCISRYRTPHPADCVL